jgi:hypothetical protein
VRGVSTDDRSGSMGRFLGELPEFSGLAPEVRGFAPEFQLEFHDFGTCLFECLVPFAGITERRSELRCELACLLPKGLISLVICSRAFLVSAASRASSLRVLTSRSNLRVSSLTFFLSWSSSRVTVLLVLRASVDFLFAAIGLFT